MALPPARSANHPHNIHYRGSADDSVIPISSVAVTLIFLLAVPRPTLDSRHFKGLNVLQVLSKPGSGSEHHKNSAVRTSDMTAMIGTLFL
jgi:hypothetical protein